MTISIIVPCYLDEHGLPELFARLGSVLDTLAVAAEVILVDDASPDRTTLVARQLADRWRYPVTVVTLVRNVGQHAATLAGMELSRGDRVVTIDSDLEYPPEQIPRLVAALEDGHKVVSGQRTNRQDSRTRRLASALLSRWIRRRTGATMRDAGSTFRVYDRLVVDQILTFSERRPYLPALVAWLGVPVREVPVEQTKSAASPSRFRVNSLLDLGFDILTGYSISPLRLLSLVAIVGSVLGFGMSLAFAVYRVVVGAGVSGLVSAFALLFFLTAMQLLLLSLLSEYVGRIYVEVRPGPANIARDVYRSPVQPIPPDRARPG